MKSALPLILLLSLSFNLIQAQNAQTHREAFTLKLPVDKTQFYEQAVEKSPYFVKDKVLQLYAGEKVLIEVDTSNKGIRAMRVVKTNMEQSDGDYLD